MDGPVSASEPGGGTADIGGRTADAVPAVSGERQKIRGSVPQK